MVHQKTHLCQASILAIQKGNNILLICEALGRGAMRFKNRRSEGGTVCLHRPTLKGRSMRLPEDILLSDYQSCCGQAVRPETI